MILHQMKYLICTCSILVVFALTTTQSAQFLNNTVLLYSTKKDIRVLNTTKSKVTSSFLIGHFNEGAALDYHYELRKLCWTNPSNESILCDEFDGVATKNKVEVISTGVESASGLACDWLTNKLYWTESETKRIEVASMEKPYYRKVLYWSDLDLPRAIALAPNKGLMFWTDWGEVPKIERATMDGNPHSRKVIVNTTIFWPNGLSVDYESELIYWVDGKLKFIEVMNFDGTNRNTILKSNLEYPFALAMFQNKFFWTDWKNWSIFYFDLNNQKTMTVYDHPTTTPMYIQIYDKNRQQNHPNPCQQSNGFCSHLCLLSPEPKGYSCACPVGIKLLDNYTCADKPLNLLLLARRTDILTIYLDSPDYTHKTLPLDNVTYTIAVDFDPVEQYIYWSDDEEKKIQKARLDGSGQTNVVTDEIQHPDGIAIDYVARSIYWTDAGTDRVEVCRLQEKYRRVVIYDGLMDPRAIAVAPELGWLFWSDWFEKDPKIERSNLDGSERKVLVSENLGWPNGITLDLSKQRLYWCDAKIDIIEYAMMNGSNRRILINENVPHVFGFTLMGDFLYWTDWQRRTIDRAHKDTGAQREIILDQVANVMGLKAINLQNVTATNTCKKNNGDCSQFCFYRHNKTKICACELGYELASDGLSCIKPEIFLLYSRKNQIGMIGIQNKNNEVTIPISGIGNCSSIGYNIDTKRIYWTDTANRKIMRALIDGSNPQPMVDLGLVSPESIAIDWLGLNIYWTDPQTQRIEVMRLLGSSRKALLWEGKIQDPHGIVVDPPNGLMYWSEWGSSKSIKKAAMDGSNIDTLVDAKGYATQLTLDYDDRRLYWIELNSAAIWSVDLNGNDAKVVVSDAFKPVGLAIYKDNLYWSDNQTGQIIQAKKYDASSRQIIHKDCFGITDIQVYSPKIHGSNQCATSNAGCKHLCLALPASVPEEGARFTCACPTHYTVDTKDSKECIPPQEFMIYSQKNITVRVSPNPAGCLETVLPIQGLKGVKAIDFDPETEMLYWVEKTHLIKRAALDGTEVTTVVHGNKDLQPYDIAIDYVGRVLFWTSSYNVINVTRLDTLAPFGVVAQKPNEKPKLLAIHITQRLLFYTDVGEGRQLVRTRLDGTHRLVITKDAEITAIAVDQENDRIIWSKGQSVFMTDFEAQNTPIALVNDTTTKNIQLTILSGWLYWIDREFQLQRVDLHSLKPSEPLSLQATHIVDLISVTIPSTNHHCKKKVCSHFCIMDGTNPICACPDSHKLTPDKDKCSPLKKCGNDSFTCATHSEDTPCIPIQWRCDREIDCIDGSDEENCAQCLNNQFRCKNNTCIDENNRCDGIDHCGDRSDEEGCCTNGFLCPNTQVCLTMNLVCDQNEHCADGADEYPSNCRKPQSSGLVWIVLGTGSLIALVAGVTYCYVKKTRAGEDYNDQSEDSLSPMQPKPHIKIRKGIPDVVRMSIITGSETSYDRNHITGASSSTIESSLNCYPCEPLNPPPSPATTRGSSPSSRYRPYRHYRSINQPPPPTPCSTDVCDESDCNYPTRSRYDGGPFPPPPTPRSHCHSESCPPSPSSRSSTYFNPLPPPPSPVASQPRGYDS